MDPTKNLTFQKRIWPCMAVAPSCSDSARASQLQLRQLNFCFEVITVSSYRCMTKHCLSLTYLSFFLVSLAQPKGSMKAGIIRAFMSHKVLSRHHKRVFSRRHITTSIWSPKFSSTPDKPHTTLAALPLFALLVTYILWL